MSEEKKPFSEQEVDALVEGILHSRSIDGTVTVPPPEEGFCKEEPEDDARIYIPKKKTASPVEEATRRIQLPREWNKDSVPAEPVEESGDQLSWEDVTEAMPQQEPPVNEADAAWQESLRLAREEKIRSFRLERGLKLSGEEEEEMPSPSAQDEPEFIDDFNSYEEAELVRNELRYRLQRGRTILWVSLLCELVLVGIYFLFSTGVFTNPYMYIADAAGVLVILSLFNYKLFRDGLVDAKNGQWSSETVIGLASVLTLVHTLLQPLWPETAAVQLLPMLSGFGLLLGAWNRQLQRSRIVCNFEFVAENKEKWAALKIDDPADADEVGRCAVAVGQPEVAYFHSVPFLHHYLGCAYERHEESPWLRWYLVGVGAVSLLVALIYGIAYQSFGDAFTLFVTLCVLGAPLASGMVLSAPLLRAARRVHRRGGMLIGETPVQEFGHLHAVAVDAADIFPEHTVLLSGLKVFAGTRIDEAILDAAAVSVAAGGPLSAVFRRIIQNRTDLLEGVDTLVYEQEMGLSGWVGGRRVLVGNRRLLENHGVDVPSLDYEMKYRQNGGQLVYLSTAGELSAMFIVTYTADPTIVEALQQLHKEEITLLVRTCDPNITQELVCQTLGVDDYYVEILGASARRRYERLTGEELGEVNASLASDGSLASKAAGLVYCRRLYSGCRLALASVLACGVVCLVLCSLLALAMGRLLPTSYLLLCMGGSTAISLLLPLVKKV